MKVTSPDGLYSSVKVEKAEVSLDELFNGDNFYGKQMKLEFAAWRKMYPDQKFSREEYTQNQLNTYAFQYTSIRDQPEKKEFGWQMAILGATIISAGVTLFCPPVGLALVLFRKIS